MQNNHSSLVNGSFNDFISLSDRGLAYGDGVFRTLKVTHGTPEHWPLHYQMLVSNCSVIGLVCPSAELFMSDFEQLFSSDEISVAKIIVSRGHGDRGYVLPAVIEPTRIMIKSNFPHYPQENFDEGVQLHLCETRLALQPRLAGIKHLNRLENVLARMEWNDSAINEGLMMDTTNNVIECTSSNIFARYNDVLLTPSIDECGIAGISRQRILSYATSLDLKVRIEKMSLKQLLKADEVIICNSLYGAWQVRKLTDKQWEKQALASNLRELLTA